MQPAPIQRSSAIAVSHLGTPMGVIQPALVTAPVPESPVLDDDELDRFSETEQWQPRSQPPVPHRTAPAPQANSETPLNLHQAQYLPAGVTSGVNGPVSSRFGGQSAESERLLQDALASKAHSKGVMEPRQGTRIDKIAPQELGEMAPKITPAATMKRLEQEDEAHDTPDPPDETALERLAQEVYYLLQQRLTVERERYGGYYRSRSRF